MATQPKSSTAGNDNPTIFNRLTPALWALGIVALGLVSGYAGSRIKASPTVVFVRTNEVMARYKGAIQAREHFQKETSAWADESKNLEAELAELAKTAKSKDEKALERARQLQSRIRALRDKGGQRDQELMTPVLAEVNSGIKKFAQAHGYRIVLGTLSGGVVLHGDDAVDVTEQLITEMNR